MDNTKKKKPKDLSFTQQKMLAWQPILSPPWVIATFIIIFLIFTPLGTIILLASESVTEVVYDYTDTCTPVPPGGDIKLPPTCFTTVLLNLTKPMKSPVYIYYKLDGFYQNHRRYAASRDDYQLAGHTRSAVDLNENCKPVVNFGPSDVQGTANTPQNEIYNPCGLIAWSMFNDTFVLKNSTATVCNGPNPTPGGSCTKDGIAWSSDVNVKFRAPSNDTKYRSYPQDYYNETGHIIPSVTDPDFIVWMRTAALPSFRKLYRIITDDLRNGTYPLEITQNYPVHVFGGRKAIILSTASWIGGKNLFLAIAYFVVAGICLIMAIGFTIASIIMYRIRQSKSKAFLQKTVKDTSGDGEAEN